MHSSAISDSRRDNERKRAFCLIGITKQPWPVTMRNCVSSALRLEPEIKSASLGAGTCQKSRRSPFRDRASSRKRGDADGSSGKALDDQDSGVFGDVLVRACGERFGAS